MRSRVSGRDLTDLRCMSTLRCMLTSYVKGELQMKAVTQDGYCGPEELRLEEVPKPEIAEDEVLVKVKASAVNPFDWHVMRGDPAFARLLVGLRRPKVPI